MNFIPQVETQELSDSDLDNVSGGLLGGLVGNATATLDSVAPVSGTLGSVTGTVEGVTGLNTAAVTGLATTTVAGV
ncbi:type A2 lantipeptide [Streptomyces sp. NBC_01142]|uniref:type A2 lantipeptide n=1 Tax=Streptomyces sp. NBC_01142 TaxID=2975865 RepID=UPI002257B396|nr:type A2 lantipeptide [Streptomyces sp. NBC_01142]MCX4820744.1 type A2 lantipeptide [Streptomyces sp. NBC_01142]